MPMRIFNKVFIIIILNAVTYRTHVQVSVQKEEQIKKIDICNLLPKTEQIHICEDFIYILFIVMPYQFISTHVFVEHVRVADVFKYSLTRWRLLRVRKMLWDFVICHSQWLSTVVSEWSGPNLDFLSSKQIWLRKLMIFCSNFC